ncbi:hypothetical protein ACNKHM_04825 [Shigella sonnei]
MGWLQRLEYFFGWIFGEWALRGEPSLLGACSARLPLARRDVSLWLHWGWRRVDYRRGSLVGGLWGVTMLKSSAAGG